ncbi:MATE family efflux transporter [Alteromonas sp. a30]|uniref:MATE family efflux transporter n=1 Tax=Alteromonas sp. a30 TaxID=2730917 RepID=UPI002281EB14|nr:MATE family efflux transporter [Alteromonas sp. a30]MCY7297022.1 MATE family efflux transporter [Alteromonas sp. a30]
MTLPVVLSMILLMSFGLVDTFFVGLLGTDQLASISFTFPVTFTLISLNIGLGIGTSATVARLLGSGDRGDAKIVGNGALSLAGILCGFIALVGWFFLEPIFHAMGAEAIHLPYIRDYMNVWFIASVFLAIPMVGNSILRAHGDTTTPSIIMATGGFINAMLDPLLIFGWGPFPALGIQGASIATMIAWMVSTAYILYLLAIKRQLILPRLLQSSEFSAACKGVLRIGIPAAGSNMITPMANGIMTAIVAQYGSAAVATWGVGNRLESMANIIPLSLSMTLPPLISQNFGAERIDRVKQAYMSTVKFVMVWQMLVFLLMWVMSPFIASAFAQDAEVEKLIVLFLAIVPIGYGLQGIVVLTNSSLNAMHRPMGALALSVVRFFIIFVPICYLGSLLFNLPGIFWGSVVSYIVMGAISFFCFNRLLVGVMGNTAKENSTS